MSRIDAESSVIGACLVDQQGYWKVADLLSADDFSTDIYRALWIAIAELRKAGKDADFVTVGEKNPELASDALRLANHAAGSAQVRGYAEWVLQAATERRVRLAGHRIAKLAGDDVLGEAQRILGTCAPRSSGAVRPVREYLRESVARMQERYDATEIYTGVPSGIPQLDEMTAGFQRGDLIVIAARPSVGKTALALQCALHAAGLKHPVLFMSLEMTGSQIADRAIAHLGRLDSVCIREPKRLDEAQWTKVSGAGATLAAMPFFIDDSSRPAIEALCARVRQCNAANRLGLVAIDYLGLMKLPKADKKTDAIGEITGQLKALAKELQVPILLLCQLNRGAAGIRPTLDSLRDSGDIEQDADIVIFLHRPNDADRSHIELIVSKQRNGPTGEFFLAAHMDKMRFDPSDRTDVIAYMPRNKFPASKKQADTAHAL